MNPTNEHYDRRAPRVRQLDPEHRGGGLCKEIVEDRPAALLRAISGLSPARILGVGCGTGFLAQHLGRRVETLTKELGGRVLSREGGSLWALCPCVTHREN